MTNNVTRPDRKSPISDEELSRAVLTTGYPLEVRLLAKLEEAGLQPTIGSRYRVVDSERVGSITREIDLTTLLATQFAPTAVVILRAFIEAKSLAPWERFVGFPWNRPSAEDLREFRAQTGGVPSYGLSENSDEARAPLVGTNGLAEAFDKLNDAPFCVQWAIAARSEKKGESVVAAAHPQDFWDSVDALVRAADTDARESTSLGVGKSRDGAVLISFREAVLVIKTDDDLTLVNADGRIQGKTSRLCLLRPFDLGNGKVGRRIVDVVTEGAFDEWAHCHKQVFTCLVERAASHHDALVTAANAQKDRAIRAALQSYDPRPAYFAVGG